MIQKLVPVVLFVTIQSFQYAFYDWYNFFCLIQMDEHIHVALLALNNINYIR